jgi:hypothetical protein
MLVLIFAIQMIMSIVMLMGIEQFFPSGYGYGFVCPLGTLPSAIPTRTRSIKNQNATRLILYSQAHTEKYTQQKA